MEVGATRSGGARALESVVVGPGRFRFGPTGTSIVPWSLFGHSAAQRWNATDVTREDGASEDAIYEISRPRRPQRR